MRSTSLRAACVFAALVAAGPARAGGFDVGVVEIDGVPVRPGATTLIAGQEVDICVEPRHAYYFSGSRDQMALVPMRLEGRGLAVGTSVRLDLEAGSTARTGGMETARICGRLSVPSRVGDYTLSFSRIADFAAVDAKTKKAGPASRREPTAWQRFADVRITNDAAEIRPFRLFLRLDGKVPGSEINASGGFSEKPVGFSWFVRTDESGAVLDRLAIEYRHRLLPPGLPDLVADEQAEFRWSAWSSDRQASYFFILPGRHVFEVQARYRVLPDAVSGTLGAISPDAQRRKAEARWARDPADAASRYRDGGTARYEFSLAKAFVARPDPKQLIKGDKGFAPSAQGDGTARASVATTDVYGSSRAFLAGVAAYDHPRLLPLDFVDRDLAAVSAALGERGFQVDQLPLNPSRNQILTALERFVAQVKEGDRVILYFSMHGFQDSDVRTRAFIAPKDCIVESPEAFCIPLAHIRQLTEKLQTRGARHTLVVLDTCSAGLGVLEKSIARGYFENEIARAKGAHMITAGLANQVARMDAVDLKMSYFTHFFVEGLKGKADLTGDGVVSLSELLVYVRSEVARVTGGEQTPMLGRIEGSGEMVFPLH